MDNDKLAALAEIFQGINTEKPKPTKKPRKKREYTEEQRQKMVERMAKMREKSLQKRQEKAMKKKEEMKEQTEPVQNNIVNEEKIATVNDPRDEQIRALMEKMQKLESKLSNNQEPEIKHEENKPKSPIENVEPSPPPSNDNNNNDDNNKIVKNERKYPVKKAPSPPPPSAPSPPRINPILEKYMKKRGVYGL